jgi:hypothetical protein
VVEPSTRKCSRVGCNERYPLVLRGGRNSDKARVGRRQTYHQGRRYCSDTCRKLASKTRLGALQPSPKTGSRGAQAALAAQPASTPLSTVTSALSTLDISIGYEGQKTGRASLRMTFGRYAVVLDPDWPAMYRVRRPDGSLTDTVNLTRARDAARSWGATRGHLKIIL